MRLSDFLIAQILVITFFHFSSHEAKAGEIIHNLRLYYRIWHQNLLIFIRFEIYVLVPFSKAIYLVFSIK